MCKIVFGRNILYVIFAIKVIFQLYIYNEFCEKQWKLFINNDIYGKKQIILQFAPVKGGLYMKLILAIINKEDSTIVSQALVKARYSVTKLATTGGFLMSGNITLIIGTEDDKVDDVIRIIGEHAQKRTEIVPSTVMYGVGMSSSIPLEVTVGGATIFVLPVDRFEKV